MNNSTTILNKNIDIDKISNPKLKEIIDEFVATNQNSKSIPFDRVQYDDEYVDYADNCYKDGGWG